MRLWVTLKIPVTESHRELSDRISKELLEHPLVEDIGVITEKNSRLGKEFVTLMGVFDGLNTQVCLGLASSVYREVLEGVPFTDYDMEWTYRLLHDKVEP